MPARGLRPFPVLLVCAALSASAVGETLPLERYVARSWTTVDGLPQSSATALAQDAYGYLWVGTFGGLSRFDGVRFETQASQEACASRVTALALDEDGALWVGSERSGLCVLRGGTLVPFPPPDGKPVGAVAGITVAGREVWAATDHGLLRTGPRGFRRFGTEDGLPDGLVSAVSCASDGTLLVGTRKGLYRLRGDRVEPVPASGLSEATVYAIARDREGDGLWIGSADGLVRVAQGRAEKVPAGGAAKRVVAVLVDAEGVVWAGADLGDLVRVVPGSAKGAERVSSVTGGVRSLLQDREGGIWAGTLSKGLVRLSPGAAFSIGGDGSPVGVPVVPVVGDGEGGVWAGLNCAGLVHVTPGGIEPVPTGRGGEAACPWALHRDRAGTLWIGTHGQGLFRLEGRSAVSRGGPPNPDGIVRAIDEEPDGALLVGTGAGLFRHRVANGAFELVPGTEALDVFAIVRLPDGSAWLGTLTGPWAYEAGQVRRVAAGRVPDAPVRAIHRDREGVTWIGTYGRGLFRLEGESAVHLGVAEGLFEENVSRIVEDAGGRLWMTGNLGVRVVDRRELDLVARGQRSRADVVLFGTVDGMRTQECNGGGQPAGWLDGSGLFWVPTVDGLSVFDTRRATAGGPPLAVRIEGMTAAGRPLDLTRPLRLEAAERNLEIRYSAPSFASPERIRFRYLLSGVDPDWVDAGARRVAYYPYLPPGSYVFRVGAATPGGSFGEAAVPLRFEIPPRFTQTWLFWLLCLAAAAALVGAGVSAWIAAAGRRERLLEREVAARTAELEKLGELTRLVAEAETLEQALDQVYERFRTAVPYERIGYALVDEARGLVKAVWARGESPGSALPAGYAVALSATSLARVLETGEPRILDDLESYLAAHPSSESTRRIVKDGMRSSLTCPLSSRGRPVGFLFFSSVRQAAYDQTHVRFLRQIAGQLSQVLEKSRLLDDLRAAKEQLETANRELAGLATTDGLTGLANRRAFDEMLRMEWRRSGRSELPLSFLLVDIDHFKPYNDLYGHTKGDACLRRVAQALGHSLRRAGDVAARYGGEEFAILLPDTSAEDALRVAELLRSRVASLSEPHAGSSAAAHVTVSVGAATVIASRTGDPQTLVSAADAALYDAKEAGRNRVAHRSGDQSGWSGGTRSREEPVQS